MKFETTASFDRDFTKLPREHQRLFRDAVANYFLPAVAAGAFTGDPLWPPRLRIHQLRGTNVYSLTWNFSSPDGRATFHLDTDQGDSALLVWRRVGTHHIYKQP